MLRFEGIVQHVKAEPVTEPVIDTTAAGDSFAAAYIAARLAGAEPFEAARAGHRLAGIVVCHPGAIIPRSAMPAIDCRTDILLQGVFMTSAPKQQKLAALFKSACVIPVLTIERLEDAVPLARALVAGGVRHLEVTLRTPVAVEAAKAIIANVPDAVVGIGTILNASDLSRAEALGAQFGISPGATPELLKAAAASDIAVRAGYRDGVRIDAGVGARLRPRQILSGRAVRRYQGPSRVGRPISQNAVCPTGGIGEANAAPWLAEPNVVAVGGSWLCPAADIRSGNWTGITAMCERAMKSLKPA